WGGVHKGRPFAVPILASERVRYVGEPVAVVVAETADALADTLTDVAVDYQPLPPLAGVDVATSAPTRVHDAWPDNTTLPVAAKIGDADGAFAGAAVVVGGRFRHPRLAAAPIETRGAIAWPDAESGSLVIWASIQNPYRLRDVVSTALGV